MHRRAHHPCPLTLPFRPHRPLVQRAPLAHVLRMDPRPGRHPGHRVGRRRQGDLRASASPAPRARRPMTCSPSTSRPPKGDTDQLVFKAPAPGTLNDPENKQAIEDTLKSVSADKIVAGVDSPFSPGGQIHRGRARSVSRCSTTRRALNDLEPADLVKPVEDTAFKARSRQAPPGRARRHRRAGRALREPGRGTPRRSSASSPRRSCCSSPSGRSLAMGLPLLATLLALGFAMGEHHADQPSRRHARLRHAARDAHRPWRRRRLRALRRHRDTEQRCETGSVWREGRGAGRRHRRAAPCCSPPSTVVIALLGLLCCSV